MNLFRTIYLLILFLWGSLTLFAQTFPEPCATMHHWDLKRAQYPEAEERMEQIERFTAEFVRQHKESGTRNDLPVVTIPVVFHIVYHTPAQNISLAQIESQLRILNEDFRKLNADTTNIPPEFQPVAADAQIEFCLASIDPDGNPTDGITRTSTANTVFGFDDAMKFDSLGGKSAWPRDQYLNFWVCDLFSGLLGYAQFPAAAGLGPNPAETDGVVVDFEYTGDIGTAEFTNYAGRVGTHEVGHWLNLRHVWGDGDCSVDDFVEDTPIASFPSSVVSPCSFPGPDHCDEGFGDLPNMFQNYMDYADGVCQNMLTEGQKLRMLALFAPGGERESLLSSEGCCPQRICPRPQGELSQFTDSSVQISWSGLDTTLGVHLQYRPAGDSVWIDLGETTDSTFFLNDLQVCAEYEIRLESYCNVDSSGFCELLSFRTEGCCLAPAPEVLAVGADFGQINWYSVYGALDYAVRYRPFGDTIWVLQTIADTSLNITGLSSCAGFEVQVRALCDTLGEAYSLPDTFFTTGCEACADLPYCEPGNSTSSYYLSYFGMGPINQSSGDDAGYGNFSAYSFPLLLDTTYEFSLTRGVFGVLPQASYLWIDGNQDGDFDDPNEQLYVGQGNNDSLVSGSIYIPETFLPGRTRLRVANQLQFGAGTLAPCATAIPGEFEDYCIELKAPCVLPAEFQAELDSTTKDVFLSWSSESYTNSFMVEYRPVQDSLWQEVMVGDFNQVILDSALFAECSQYVFRIASLCEDGPSASIAAPDTITTECRTGLNPALASQIRLYPNPSQGSWTVEAPIFMQQIELIDLYGRTVLKQDIRSTRWEVNTPEVANGMYLVRIQTDQGNLTRRLLINRQN